MATPFTKPYVDALFEVAGGTDAVEALLPALDALAATLDTSEELRSFLRNPAIDRPRKNAALDAIVASVGPATPPLAVRLLKTLLANGRLPSLHQLVDAVRDRLDARRGVVEATLRTAAPLPNGTRETLQTVLEERTRLKIRLKSEIDPTLLGGFVVRVGSEVLDASLSRRLQRARRALHSVPQMPHRTQDEPQASPRA
jgi:F-type H+-transporting ATPase subunit delta